MLRVLISCLALMHLSSAALSRQVNTSSGIVQGYIDPEYPSISQYRAIPFGEPPVGDLRFAAPIAKKYQSSLIDGTSYGSQCLQLGSGKQTGTALKDNPGLFVSSVGHAESAEDCLTLAVWTPTWAIDSCASLPVIVWFFGGGFISGGTDSAYYNGAPWTQRTQEHIVVTFNYRTNIMGTPNAQGLALTNDNLNFGLQDQRLAVEWVHGNIANFGGDPLKITIWGQSAGSISVDHYQFAYPNNSLITGFISESGNAFYRPGSNAGLGVDFSFVADQIGCTNLAAAEELSCMRSLPFDTLKRYIQSANVNPNLTYHPVVDNVTVFPRATYPDRLASGKSSRVPTIMGTTAQEGYAYIAWDSTTEPPASMVAEADARTADFGCAALVEVDVRCQSGLISYQYVYDGNFSDISPLPWIGAFHASDAPMFFGTYNSVSSAFQRVVSHRMQDVVLAFMQDPIYGPQRFGWPQTTSTGPIVKIGAAPHVFVNVSKADALAECAAMGLS